MKNEIKSNKSRFVESLRKAVNCHSIEGESNTPDFILADLMVSMLDAFSDATNQRDKWHGFVPFARHVAPSPLEWSEVVGGSSGRVVRVIAGVAGMHFECISYNGNSWDFFVNEELKGSHPNVGEAKEACELYRRELIVALGGKL